MHFIVVSGDGGDLAAEPRLAQTFKRGDVGAVTRHRQHGNAHRVGALQLVPEVQIGGVTLDHSQALLREALDSGPVKVDTHHPESIVICKSLVGSKSHSAHPDHHDLGVAGVTGSFFGMQCAFILGGKPGRDLFDHQMSTSVDQCRHHEAQCHRDRHLDEPGLA